MYRLRLTDRILKDDRKTVERFGILRRVAAKKRKGSGGILIDKGRYFH